MASIRSTYCIYCSVMLATSISRILRFCRRMRYSNKSSGPSNASRKTSSARGGMYKSLGSSVKASPKTTANGISPCCGCPMRFSTASDARRESVVERPVLAPSCSFFGSSVSASVSLMISVTLILEPSQKLQRRLNRGVKSSFHHYSYQQPLSAPDHSTHHQSPNRRRAQALHVYRTDR